MTGDHDDAAEAWRTRERGVHLEDGGTTTDEVESERARAGGSLEELYSMGRAAWRERRMSRLQGILFASRRRAKRRKKELQLRADRGCEDGRQSNTGSIMDCAVACVCRRSSSFFEWCWLMAASAAAAVYCALRSTSCSVRGEQARRMAILASKWRLSQARMSGGSRGMDVLGMMKEARRGPESPLCSLTSASNAGNLHPLGGGCPGQRAAPGYSGAMALISSTSAPSPLRTGKPVPDPNRDPLINWSYSGDGGARLRVVQQRSLVGLSIWRRSLGRKGRGVECRSAGAGGGGTAGGIGSLWQRGGTSQGAGLARWQGRGLLS